MPKMGDAGEDAALAVGVEGRPNAGKIGFLHERGPGAHSSTPGPMIPGREKTYSKIVMRSSIVAFFRSFLLWSIGLYLGRFQDEVVTALQGQREPYAFQ